MTGMKHDHDHGDAACAHAAHQSERAPDALAEAESACEARGARLTPIRRQVLEALYTTHRPLGAYDLAEGLSATGGRRVAPIQVYRALDFLMEQDNAFIACPHRHGPADLVAFLICEGCGGVDELASPAVSESVSHLLSAERFKPHMQVLEISGRCAHCREAH
jgi:Fur family transcriptional regulator, zinc uptake regulator